MATRGNVFKCQDAGNCLQMVPVAVAITLEDFTRQYTKITWDRQVDRGGPPRHIRLSSYGQPQALWGVFLPDGCTMDSTARLLSGVLQKPVEFVSCLVRTTTEVNHAE